MTFYAYNAFSGFSETIERHKTGIYKKEQQFSDTKHLEIQQEVKTKYLHISQDK
jgi:hypothetical protein